MKYRNSAARAFTVAALALTGSASAQQRVNQQGDALDANNRVGDSRSYGAPRSAINDRFRLNNALITRDVTAGRAFRDFVPYASDRSFRDFTAGRFSSSFAGNASGVTPSGVVINNAQIVQPYYGSSRIVQPPPDYTRLPGTGGYVPPSAVRPLDNRADLRSLPGYSGRASAFDPHMNLRLGGDGDRAGFSYIDAARPAAPGSPLLYQGATADTGLFISPYTQLARDTRLEPLTPQRLAELRSELLQDGEEPPLAESEPGGGRRAEGAQSTSEQSNLGARQTESRAEGAAPVAPTAGGLRQRLDETLQQHAGARLADPAQQSSQYAQLQDRLRRFRESGSLEAARPLGSQPQQGSLSAGAAQPIEAQTQQPAPAAGQPQVPGGQQPGAQPAQPGAQPPARVPGLPEFFPPIGPRAYPVPGAAAPGAEPVEIHSLADGMTSPTLRRMYQQAEELMAEGRYVSAIARYEAAERLVPNQPLTSLGRAVAELGAGYYRRSATSLRQGFTRSPELLMARLNLANFIGEKRLAEVTQTLGQRLAAEAQDPDPAFLLAFIAYHGRDRAEAARLLSLAEDRSGDFFYAEVAAHWGLRSGVAPTTRPAEQP